MAAWLNHLTVKRVEKEDMPAVERLSKELRRTDKIELALTEADVCKDALDETYENYITYYDTEPIFIGGISKKEYTGYGHAIWAVCRYDTYTQFKREWVVVSSGLISNWRRQYGTLWNMILDTNAVSKAWLKKQGATFSEPFLFNDHTWRLFTIQGVEQTCAHQQH